MTFGSPRIRVRCTIPGLPFDRIEVRTLTDDADQIKRLKAFVITLVDKQDIDALIAIRQGGWKALYETYTRVQSNQPAIVSNDRSALADALLNWVNNEPKTKRGKLLKPSTVKGYRECIMALLKHAKANATVQDLPDVLFAYRQHCERKDQNSRFRQARTTCLTYARSTHRRAKKSPLFVALDEIENMHADRKRERKSTLTPRQVRRIMRTMKEQGSSHLSQHIWNLAATGARPDEYVSGLVHFMPERNCVFVDGTKTKSAKRFLPLLPGVKDAPTKLVRTTGKKHGKTTTGQLSVYSLSMLRKAFRLATNGEFTLYDLRGSMFVWMRRAGVESIMRKPYLGHSMRGVTEGYHTLGDVPQWTDWKSDVRRDRVRLVRYLQRRLKKRQPV